MGASSTNDWRRARWRAPASSTPTASSARVTAAMATSSSSMIRSSSSVASRSVSMRKVVSSRSSVTVGSRPRVDREPDLGHGIRFSDSETGSVRLSSVRSLPRRPPSRGWKPRAPASNRGRVTQSAVAESLGEQCGEARHGGGVVAADVGPGEWSTQPVDQWRDDPAVFEGDACAAVWKSLEFIGAFAGTAGLLCDVAFDDPRRRLGGHDLDVDHVAHSHDPCGDTCPRSDATCRPGELPVVHEVVVERLVVGHHVEEVEDGFDVMGT